ncbi:manganese efflux pump MntP [Desulfosporosinus nitroreducens]|uniref:Putative manganese efflux pump MntP n=1 Tax=Desulfosporosinus nitroreducens TaxID=2018668 RepID=A0ABT8QKZ3_9FIRM|nr:manganese efflux pump MntP family protein [Desulfosporosinus nitroreducens]MCO1601510.1 manganese efflux pump MntP family protein [Desulfosporosinus nitroreducens]MDO0822006.1 manganese efflux pump MntP family protein [Desulfosporosinus nitroreducens]
MNLVWVVAVATALGADAFSLALAIGLAGIRKSMMVRLSFIVALFHVFMPLSGMILGQALGSILGQFASLLGALVLIGLGGRMLYKVYRPTKQSFPFGEARETLFHKNNTGNSTLKGYGIYVLAASVSLDALSVGFSLGTIRADIFMTVMIIGMIAGLMTGMGLVLGRIMGTRLGEKAELFGGLALFLIGIKLLL